MKDGTAAAPNTVQYLHDYAVPNYLVDHVALDFILDGAKTRVLSKIQFRPNPDATDDDFFLHGENLHLIAAKINGDAITPTLTPQGLRCAVPNTPFTFEAEVQIDPTTNTALEGLYTSGGMYCTQCEAEGFRKITFYPDRPDVMAPFDVRIKSDLPVMLSNGNPQRVQDGWTCWSDPWPKPAYLFALVAGDLRAHSDQFTTQSGRDVALNIWVRPDDLTKCAFGMSALKSSMAWDERVYGREYDLDVFNIVAVDDFNMGAMENKGLNIFNSSCVLASPETATDANFERIEAIIAHEYFHNWTGNRITCRDWFQLCLKEGLTVFRDAQFTADMRSAPVKRIEDVTTLRARQFPEDQGPLAHPVRPDQYQEINNFYTATVYEKGAEVIGMLKTLVGDAAYAKALALYFERHDGQACTIEDWLAVFEDVTGRDLTQFKRWYTQSGTPHVYVDEDYSDGTLTLTLRQETPKGAQGIDKQPFVIPLALGLIAPGGTELLPTQVVEFSTAELKLTFDNLPCRPIPSLLRGFSAPVVLHQTRSNADLVTLLAHDTDPFNTWEASNQLAFDCLTGMVLQGAAPNQDWLSALHSLLANDAADPAYLAMLLRLPAQAELAAHLHDHGHTPDPVAIHTAQETLLHYMAEQWAQDLPIWMDRLRIDAPYDPGAQQAGKRALGSALLRLISHNDVGATARSQYGAADNMTLQLSALMNIARLDHQAPEITAFYDQWRHDRLVMDKWFALQISVAAPDQVAQITAQLCDHPDFTMTNPNRFRAVFGALAGHHAGFHHDSGAGYALLADWLIKLDAKNPQTTARMCSAFQTWRRYGPAQQTAAQTALKRILNKDGLSGDTREMVTRILAP